MNVLNQRVMARIQPLNVLIQPPNILNQHVKIPIQPVKTLNQEANKMIQAQPQLPGIIVLNQRGYRIVLNLQRKLRRPKPGRHRPQ